MLSAGSSAPAKQLPAGAKEAKEAAAAAPDAKPTEESELIAQIEGLREGRPGN